MSFENLAEVTFTDEELNKIDQALTDLEAVFKGKMFNLSPEERQQYGSIAEQNKLFVNKAKELMELYPQYVPQFLNKEEFDRDYQARTILESKLLRLKHLTEQLVDTKVLLDHDNYSNALTFYRNLKFLNGEHIPGVKALYEALKQFFKGGRPGKSSSEVTETPSETD